jgi:hypothetical protein
MILDCLDFALALYVIRGIELVIPGKIFDHHPTINHVKPFYLIGNLEVGQSTISLVKLCLGKALFPEASFEQNWPMSRPEFLQENINPIYPCDTIESVDDDEGARTRVAAHGEPNG